MKRLLVLLALFAVACTPTPSPSASPSAAATPSVVPSVAPSGTPDPTTEPTVEPSPEPTVEPTAEPTIDPSPEPVALEFTGMGSDTTESFVLPTNTYTVNLEVEAVDGATACEIDVTLVSGDLEIPVALVDSETATATVEVEVAAGPYVLKVHDPGCRWTINVASP